jgi:hypothetical protein
MPTVGSTALLRDIAASPCVAPFPQRERFRRDALDLIESEDLIAAAYCYRIVPLDETPTTCLRAGGEALDAMRLLPASGRLTAVAAAVCTLGPALEARISALFAERQHSTALALDGLANALLSALSRRLQDRIVVEARRHGLTAAGELRPGDPGMSLRTQPAVLRLVGAGLIGVSVTSGQLLHPLKSLSMVLGIGIDLPPARWSRCDDCPSASKCRMAGQRFGQGLDAAS